MLVSHLSFDLIAKRIHQFRFGHNFTTETEAVADLRKHGLCQLIVGPLVDVIKNHPVRDDDLKFISFGSHQLAESHVVFHVSAVELELRSESAHSRANRLLERLKHEAVCDVSLEHQVANSTFVESAKGRCANYGIGRADQVRKHKTADSAKNSARNTILHPASSADPCECENDSTEKDAQHDKMRALLRKHSIKGESHHRKDDDCHHPHVLISTKESKWRTHVGTLVPFGGFLF